MGHNSLAKGHPTFVKAWAGWCHSKGSGAWKLLRLWQWGAWALGGDPLQGPAVPLDPRFPSPPGLAAQQPELPLANAERCGVLR